jgi:hypothetical protein
MTFVPSILRRLVGQHDDLPAALGLVRQNNFLDDQRRSIRPAQDHAVALLEDVAPHLELVHLLADDVDDEAEHRAHVEHAEHRQQHAARALVGTVEADVVARVHEVAPGHPKNTITVLAEDAVQRRRRVAVERGADREEETADADLEERREDQGLHLVPPQGDPVVDLVARELRAAEGLLGHRRVRRRVVGGRGAAVVDGDYLVVVVARPVALVLHGGGERRGGRRARVG